ncbi:hypothetical protein Lepto7375DRAFT_6896 [Leptolyngbya sp. PCC 7375]|nr:hypothetical protein Lepto7375DRAFT_6896 [Leptolyngbya sp. PCC 7375]
MSPHEDAYHEMCCYTLAHSDPSFIHQHVVDAFGAQNAPEHDRSIGFTFALIGLYLYVEKGFTGKQVQQAHAQLARNKIQWPDFQMPKDRGEINVIDVLMAAAGAERDQMIHNWCVAVWKAFSSNRELVNSLLQNSDIL